MKLPSFRRLFTNDYSANDKALVEKLSIPFNTGVEVLYDALNQNLDFENNFQATLKDIQIIVDSNGNPTNTSGFTLINSNKINGILVLRANNQTNSAIYPTTAPFVSFLQNSDKISITNVTGLQANNTYLLRLLAI